MRESLGPASVATQPPLAASASKDVHLGPFALGTLFCLCAALGIPLIYGTAVSLQQHWRTDDLQSIGLLVPFLSCALTLRAWRAIGWRAEGSWWGFALLALLAAVVFLRDQTLFVVTVHKDWLLQVPPLPLVTVLYAAGLVLLFGGLPLLRAAWFPVLLMGAVLPVPNTFSHLVDLPLQHAAATVARGFAHLIGEKLTPDSLRLMFTPEFGMFIAPGCNGIRGAVTLGLAAVVVAHLYRFRWFIFAPLVAGAVLLGYLFNFVRLCLLVLYYKVALPYPWLQERAKGADYLIGAGLFVVALLLFFAAVDRLRRDRHDRLPPPAVLYAEKAPNALPLLLRIVALLALSAVFAADALHAQRAGDSERGAIPEMPSTLGSYRLVRTYQDTLVDGVVVYTWGEYVPAAAAAGQPVPHIAVGVSPVMDVHDTEVCHIARGEDPTSHGALRAQTPGGDVALVAATYNNGTVQTLEASTVCDAGVCRQFTSSTGAVTLVYAHPHRTLPMQQAAERPVPMLMKVETTNLGLSPAAVNAELGGQLQAFLGTVDLQALAARFRKPVTP